ncbi:MAG: response regulator [Clostridia bacterium]|nr:response regulator [Clostridia bacterium]
MKSIYIVDDDLSIVNILKDITFHFFEGSLIGSACNGSDAIKEIIEIKPDVILLDYLLPDSDGLQMIRAIRKKYDPAIVMISEVSDKKMIEKAYNEKIEFFITKPINVVEVVSVINKVIENQEFKSTLNQFEITLNSLKSAFVVNDRNKDIDEQKLRKLYSKLGIIGTSGCEELIKAVIWAKLQNSKYSLSDMYRSLAEDQGNIQQVDTLKKRIGRVITKAFKSMASLGIEDYMNPVFESYSSQLFNFGELRKEMKYLSGESKQSGKINIKQFIESSIVLLDEF